MLRAFSAAIYAQAFDGVGDEPPRLVLLVDAFNTVFNWIFPIGGLISVAMLIMGGYMWMISGGEPQRKQQAQGTLTWAIIGLVFLMLIKAILMLILGQILPEEPYKGDPPPYVI